MFARRRSTAAVAIPAEARTVLCAFPGGVLEACVRVDRGHRACSVAGRLLAPDRSACVEGRSVSLVVDHRLRERAVTDGRGNFSFGERVGDVFGVRVDSGAVAQDVALVDLTPPPAAADTHARPARPTMPLRLWGLTPPASRSAAAHALDVLPSLRELRVDAWAAACGCSQRALFGACVRWSGLSPTGVLTRYRVGIAIERRTQGATLEVCADAAEYSDVPTLRRASRSVAMELPARGRDAGLIVDA